MHTKFMTEDNYIAKKNVKETLYFHYWLVLVRSTIVKGKQGDLSLKLRLKVFLKYKKYVWLFDVENAISCILFLCCLYVALLMDCCAKSFW